MLNPHRVKLLTVDEALRVGREGSRLCEKETVVSATSLWRSGCRREVKAPAFNEIGVKIT